MKSNKNRLEIRLDPDSLELLNSLLVRTSLTKTSLIKKALIVYASALKNGHMYTVSLKGKPIKEEKTSKNEDKNEEEEIDDDIFNQLIEESKRIEEERLKKDEDKLPF